MLIDCDTMNYKCYECTNIGTNNVIINHHNINVVNLSDNEEYLHINEIFDNKQPLTNDEPFQNFSGNHVGAYYLPHSKPEQVNALEVPDKPQAPFVNDNEATVKAVQPVNH